MAARVRVKTGIGSSSESYVVEGEPDALSEQVNEAIQQGDKFVTFTGSDGKGLSVIAERIESIWGE